VHQGFRVVVLDDRAEMVTEERFPVAKRLVNKDLSQALIEYPIGSGCYVTIASRSHETDRVALEAVVNADASYVGMIGSRKKIKNTLQYLLDQGFPREKLESVYAPMGLDIASVQPKEIAVSIMSEILLVKNSGSLQHMRTVKNIQI
jgi:xanthine dehydrogenase accessory factor